MKVLLALLFFSLSLNLFCQHTDRYLKSTEGLEKIDVKNDTSFYKNGSIKRIGEKTVYKHKAEYFIVETGESVGYSKNGKIENVRTQDQYGNYLNNKFYNGSGELVREWIAIEIDSNYKSLDEFVASGGHGDFKRLIKHYRYSKNLGQRYVYKEEYRTLKNNIPTGEIKYLDENGNVKRKRYLNIDEK